MRDAVTAHYQAIDFDLDRLVGEELPFTHLFYTDAGQIHTDLADLFAFPLRNRTSMPFYQVEGEAAERMAETLTRYYAMLLDALRQLWREPGDTIRTYFDCEMMQRHGARFIDYARYTFHNPGLASQTLYGRFDAAFDPASGQVTGVYEFNGDTPVMLFESINIENLLATNIGQGEAQYNDWWPRTLEALQGAGVQGKVVAVVADTRFIEDLTTSETIAQLFEAAGADAYLVDIHELDYDYSVMEHPFYLNGVGLRPDVIFVLNPWEEMVTTFPQAFQNQDYWRSHVVLMEPPWRWFLSHKGMLAYVTHLLENDAAFAERHAGLPHLPTYLSAEPLGDTYVRKPALGRLSSNVEIRREGTLIERTEGNYADTPMVYQAYCPPGKVAGRNHSIVGGWLSARPGSHAAEVTTLCFREFDRAVLDLRNERFIPHILVD